MNTGNLSSVSYLSLLIFFIIVVVLAGIFYYRDQIKLWLLNLVIVKRGILAPNCFWYRLSDMILQDGAGINLYYELKRKYGDFIPMYIFSDRKYIVTNNRYIKTILDLSPDIFGVGTLKEKFFKSFMSKNVGVSEGCPWKRRRQINEIALVTGGIHVFTSKYNLEMKHYLEKWRNKSYLGYPDFLELGKTMVAKIVFNVDKLNDKIFHIFKEANSLTAFFNADFKISQSTSQTYQALVNHYLDHPREKSLVELCLQASRDKTEVKHQIPHFMFPIVGLFVATVPRLLLLLINHPADFRKVIREIENLENTKSPVWKKISKMSYLRKCLLETLRLNNPVLTVFRRLKRDFSFDNLHYFKEGTQFVILNNPVLREPEYYVQRNKFFPSRWTPAMEKSYYAISFNQGPQMCPGKDLAIYLVQCFMYHFVKLKVLEMDQILVTQTINRDYISQIINPCRLSFKFKNP